MAVSIALLSAPIAAQQAAAQPAAAQSVAARQDLDQYPLYEAGGTAVITVDQLRGQWVALHFLLRADCVYCLLHTQSYALQMDALPEVRHLFIKPSEEDAILRWTEGFSNGALPNFQEMDPPTIYRDPRAALASRLGVRHGYEYKEDRRMHFPAFILLNPEGEEVFRHTGEDTTDRYPFDQFAALMDAIHRPFQPGSVNLLEGGVVAVSGYDPVAYFTLEEAVEGDSEITAAFNDLVFRFANEANRAIFLEDPMRYLPAYGGWCAMNMTTGRKRDVDPANFLLRDGRLFLFSEGAYANARDAWERDIARHIDQADACWEHLSGQKPPEP